MGKRSILKQLAALIEEGKLKRFDYEVNYLEDPNFINGVK
jgi:hypothetical protein